MMCSTPLLNIGKPRVLRKTKGIISDPMPKYWYTSDKLKISPEDTDEERNEKVFQLRILANKKPYFMNYIYPDQKKEYTNHVHQAAHKCNMQFRKSLDELLNQAERTDEENTFIEWYYAKMPVGINSCVMNRICWKIEKEFNDFKTEVKDSYDFDYTIMKSGAEYSINDYYKIRQIYKDYIKQLQAYKIESNQIRLDNDDISVRRSLMQQDFSRKLYEICPNEKELCDILLDICYGTDNSKQLVWEICTDVIISNLLDKNENKISFPCRDINGEITYCGEKFTMKEAVI